MSLKVQSTYRVPPETERVARAIYPKGNKYMQLQDKFGTFFDDADFAELFSEEGQPAISPVRLILVCILQFIEGLPDRQAAEAVRTRIDWKYLLCLELTDGGFDHTVLSEFRGRLVAGSKETALMNKLLSTFREAGLLKERGKQRTDSTHVKAAARAMKRIECVGETLRHALNVLATVVPEWTVAHTPKEWVAKYGARFEASRLPSSKTKQATYIEQMGLDGEALFEAIFASESEWLHQLPAVDLLRRVWIQNYTTREDGTLRWRFPKELPPASLYISSPYDTEARYSRKWSTSWVGYKVHLTETHDPDRPHFITHVETTVATAPDAVAMPLIHTALEEKELLPEVHTVDTGYIDADLIVSSREQYEVDLLGPTREGRKSPTGFRLGDFDIDWQHDQAICPAGRTSRSWTPATTSSGKPVIKIKFSRQDCGNCRFSTQCTRSNPPRRTLTLQSQAQHEALQAARAREQTPLYGKQYAERAGIEGTISQAVRRCGARRSRYIGLAKTRLQHVLTASAINLIRVANWLAGEPIGKTHVSAFKRVHLGFV